MRGPIQSGVARHLAQRGESHRLVLEGLSHDWILLRLDDEPSVVARSGGGLQHRHEVHRALLVARHGEHPCPHRVEEAPSLCERLARHRGPNVLQMEVADSSGVRLGDRARVHAGHERVPGVEEQLQLLAGTGKQALEVLAGLHHGAHVVVVDGGQARRGDVTGNLGERRGETRPLRVRQHRPGRQRRCRVTVNRVHRLAQDAHLAAHPPQQSEVRRHGRFLDFHAAPDQPQRVPARDELQTVRCEGRAQGRRIGGHLAALLDAIESDLARLAQALRERDVPAEGRVVVVGPSDGIDAVADHRGQSPGRCRTSAAS